MESKGKMRTQKKELILLKIGGSVITEKAKGVFDRAKHQEIERIAREIAAAKVENLILIHGVGSFGHPYVEKYGLKEKKNAEGIVRTHLACKKLNLLFCDQLLRRGIFPYPIHPFSSFRINDKLELDPKLFIDVISEGFIPVSHGDMVYNRKKRFFEVLSGDTIVSELAEKLKSSKLRVGMATDTDGVYLEGKILKEIRNIELLKSLESTFSETEEKSDVTGGMIGKLKSLARVAEFAEIVIFNGAKNGNIKRFLEGKSIGTRMRFVESRESR
ncbi:MAG: isopentenyl phosphate kinase family protein [Archaeoglobus sp.]|nr:isopentenyl phosphate kinase family protein [Archaeoglobus sp.]